MKKPLRKTRKRQFLAPKEIEKPVENEIINLIDDEETSAASEPPLKASKSSEENSSSVIVVQDEKLTLQSVSIYLRQRKQLTSTT